MQMKLLRTFIKLPNKIKFTYILNHNNIFLFILENEKLSGKFRGKLTVLFYSSSQVKFDIK